MHQYALLIHTDQAPYLEVASREATECYVPLTRAFAMGDPFSVCLRKIILATFRDCGSPWIAPNSRAARTEYNESAFQP